MLEEGCESRPSTRVCRVQANLSGSTRMIYWHMGKLLRHVKFRPALRTFKKSDREREREEKEGDAREERKKSEAEGAPRRSEIASGKDKWHNQA